MSPAATAAAAVLSSGPKLQAWCPGNYHLDGSLSPSLFSFCRSAVCFLLFFVFTRTMKHFLRILFITSIPFINICEQTWHVLTPDIFFGPRWHVCVLTGEKSSPTGLDIQPKPRGARHVQQSRAGVFLDSIFFLVTLFLPHLSAPPTPGWPGRFVRRCFEVFSEAWQERKTQNSCEKVKWMKD